MKLFRWFTDNILFILTLFLLSFIPLYPKLPLIDIKNTWVYVRADDFLVIFVVLIWVIQLLRRKVTLKTPLTFPILMFWIAGAVATIHGMLIIFPTLANIYPNVSFLSFMRHIEYLSLFFVAYAGMKDKRFLTYVLITLTLTLTAVSIYGIGQRYLGFPAYLTMNEEYAKGVPIHLSRASRVPSTFAGHYDLAAYLVLIIPILVSLLFSIRNWFGKIAVLGAVGLGFVTLFMTVSRVSFFAVFVGVFFVLLFQMRKLLFLVLPIVVLLGLLVVINKPALLQRFNSTVKAVDVLVDAKTGEPIGQIAFLPKDQFQNKVIRQRLIENKQELMSILNSKTRIPDSINATQSAFIPYNLLPSTAPVLISQLSTGENLPQGTGYVNLTLSPVTRKLGWVLYEKPANVESISEDVLVFNGNFLVKHVDAYDLSFTTRFQGEWPHAIAAFERNILFGSGYGSISLAIDNNFLRMLGEIGLFGFIAFMGIFIMAAVYIKFVIPHIESETVKGYVIGFGAGVFAIFLNGTLIDVFEASKVAYVLWLLLGVTMGILHIYQTKEFNLYSGFKKAVTSVYAAIVYLFIVTFVLYYRMLNNFFAGDDFTWFHWAINNNILQYFTNADGFFYRPGTKLYFHLMYSLFWLNQNAYHMVSLGLHFIVTVLFYVLAKKVLKNSGLSALAAFIFLLLSGYSEGIFWIAATGHLFSAAFCLISVLLFTVWHEKKNLWFYLLSLLSFFIGLLFYEAVIITPLLMILMVFITDKDISIKKIIKKAEYWITLLPIAVYLAMRFFAQSHWFNGDYSYNILKLPLNIVGNTIGYILLIFLGPLSLRFYEILRNISKTHVAVSVGVLLVITVLTVLAYKYKKLEAIKKLDRVFWFGILFFFITLLPFIGLGNITSRYSYMPAMGLVIVAVILLQKLYSHLLNNGKDIALSSMAVLIACFMLFQIMQIQQIHGDWEEAGKRTNRFLVSIEALYNDEWSRQPVTFYFVNVPIRRGDAWIFPVGLKDALWFTFKNEKLTVNSTSSLDDALAAAGESVNTKIFEFLDDGSVQQVIPRRRQ